MTLRNHLDEIDLKILEIISNNARIPFKDVAEEVGISRAAVHQRPANGKCYSVFPFYTRK